MRSEAEIRRQVETRLRRWGLLALNGILWIGAAKLLYGFAQYSSFGRFDGLIVLLMVGWAVLLGLHALRTFYVEGRERLVQWAIKREHQVYGWQPLDEKPKRAESASRPAESRVSLQADDGELVDFPFSQEADVKAKHER
jgi:hypothetical protein